MSYINNFGFPGLGGTFNLENSSHGFTGLGYDGLNNGFNLGNNANGFAFFNNFGGANTQTLPRQSCPAGCYRPMPGEPCYQGGCPDGCCQFG